MRANFRHLLLSLCILIPAASLSAQATRTWVSGVGDDANPGSRTAPCKTFAGAISKTAPGGEIDALDPGGFGALTITKSITLDGGGGQVASVLVAGTNAIVVAAGVNDVVIIRNMRFNGMMGGSPNSGLNGIRFISGKALIIENCEFMGFNQSGVDVALSNPGSVSVSNTTIVGTPSVTTSNGVLVEASSSAAQVNLDRVKVVNAGGAGVSSASASSDLQMDSVWLANNATGLSTTAGTVRLSGCTIVQNGVGVSILGGSVGSFGNNKVRANASGNGPLGFGGLFGSTGGNISLQ
jgi:hypothetical protein